MSQPVRRLLWVPLLLVFWTAGTTLPAAQTAQSLETLFQNRYLTLKEAMTSRDANAILSVLSHDYRTVEIDGSTQDANDLLEQLSAATPDPDAVTETTILSASQHDKTVTVEQRYKMTTTRPGPGGKQQAIELVTTSTDTWVLTVGVWYLQQSVTESIDYTVDGKLVSHRTSAAHS
jgi:uncharacterized protein DUF4440